eukprot:Opistho-2@5040
MLSVSSLSLLLLSVVAAVFGKGRFWRVVFQAAYGLYVGRLGYLYHLRNLRVLKGGKPAVTVPPAVYGDVEVHPLSILRDNYAYVIIDKAEKIAIAVDPADPDAVLDFVNSRSLRLVALLTTHRHWDHSGGNEVLAKRVEGLDVYGSAADGIPALTKALGHGELVRLGGSINVRAYLSAGHTAGHVMYILHPGAGHRLSIFTGDALFVAGCGKCFEGSAAEMHLSLERLKLILPVDTHVWPGHEYALNNLLFASAVDHDNRAVVEKLRQAGECADQHVGCVPSTFAEECLYNPFLRAADPHFAQLFTRPSGPALSPADVFAELRRLKDKFNPRKALTFPVNAVNAGTTASGSRV